jgi:hypothetical protein
MTSMKTVGYTLETVNLIRDEADFDRLLQLTTYQHRSEDRMSSAPRTSVYYNPYVNKYFSI